MSKTTGIKKRLVSFFIYQFIVIWLLGGCASNPAMKPETSEMKSPTKVEDVKVDHSQSETVIDVINSDKAYYTSFKLPDPSRIVVDITGIPDPDLSKDVDINEGNIKDIHFKVEGNETVRMTVNLEKDLEYRISQEGNIIHLVFPKDNSTAVSEAKKEIKNSENTKKPSLTDAEYIDNKPRMIFKPTPSNTNEILGIDFTMLEHGKSQLTVTSKKKVIYDLNRVGANSLSLKIHDSTIPKLLLREIDTSAFQSALDTVKPVYNKEKNEVTLGISMREIVPFHIIQSDNRLIMDFGRIKTRHAEEKIIPLKLVDAKTASLSSGKRNANIAAAGTSGLNEGRRYVGRPMDFDFVNTDVTHILRLMNQISKENIIWDPAIKGKKVSMILNDVPWDEALDLILKNNDLAKRYVGNNIIWITTKQKMMQDLAEEEAEARKMDQKLEDEQQRLQDQKKRKEEDAPLLTEYLPVDFAKASDITKHIITSKRGKISIDPRTNTIIITDTAKNIEAAKKILRQFDTPVKQIMIESKIVDASENFSRNLGITWNNTTSVWHASQNTGQTVTLPPNASDSSGGFTPGQQVYGGTFSTNAPTSFSGTWGNIGLNFAKLTSSGLGALTLNASLALAEDDGEAKIMSAPKVIAREGSPATISSGDKLIIPATENVAATTLNASLSLTVTPISVSYNNYITMEVNVTDDSAPTSQRILQKAISTTLMVKSGDTVVIGGIMKESQNTDTSGVPVLKDIPGLGWLFKANNKTRTKSELLIFLTPTVMPSPVNRF